MRRKKTISTILQLKDSRKKELEIEVKQASDKVDTEISRLHALEKDYSDSLDCFSEKNSEGTLDIHNLNSYYDYFSRINGRISEQKENHKQCENELKSLKSSLVSAYRDKKAFEILHDKAVKKDQKEKSDSEQKESDFRAMTRRSK